MFDFDVVDCDVDADVTDVVGFVDVDVDDLIVLNFVGFDFEFEFDDLVC